MQGRLGALMREEPVVLLTGPRSSGKSFTCEHVVRSLDGTVLRLDDPAEQRAASADPTGYIRDRRHPVLIDEYQHVPELLSAIKAHLSRTGARPGSFLLAGSVRGDLVAGPETLTGRIHRARLYPLSEGEYRRLPSEAFLTTLLGGEPVTGWRGRQPLGSTDYTEIACRGGFPLAVDRTTTARARWLRDYVDDTVLRDALEHARIRKPEELLRLLRLLSAGTAQVVKSGALENDLQLDRHTISAYRQILRALFLLEELPPWKTNRSQRVVKSPKVHMADTGLATALLGLDAQGVRAEPFLAGRVVESWVVAELLKQASWLDDRPTFLHFSESERAEVDVVLERTDGSLVGLEVKLADHASSDGLKGLRRLRHLAGQRWAGGALLCSVPSSYITDDDLFVAPISMLWELHASR